MKMMMILERWCCWCWSWFQECLEEELLGLLWVGLLTEDPVLGWMHL